MPEEIRTHVLQEKPPQKSTIPEDHPYPAKLHGQYIISFAPSEDFDDLDEEFEIRETWSYKTKDFIAGNIPREVIRRSEARNTVYELLRVGWEKSIGKTRLQTYRLSDNALVGYFPSGITDDDWIHFEGVDNKKSKRKLNGYNTRRTPEGSTYLRHWHFGIQGRPLLEPLFAYTVKAHVLFSDDGREIWDSKTRLHQARRSACKGWWNDAFRDRILAAMSWLSDDDTISISLGSDVQLKVARYPETYVSPISYDDPPKRTDRSVFELGDQDEVDDLGDGEDLE